MTERIRPVPPGEPGMKQMLDEIIRVDHAGEFGAVQIYRGQIAVFEAMHGKERMVALLREMEKGEQEHLDTFDRLIADRDVRPTAMAPVWRLLGFGLGAATALMGEKAAHACTAAVEEVIEEHYAQQAKSLDTLDPELGEVVGRYREDELKHRDTAILEGAKNAPAYGLLSEAIKFGCRAAIAVSKRV